MCPGRFMPREAVTNESMLLFALNITVWDGHEVFSSVPRLTGWFFQRLVYGGVRQRINLALSAFPSTGSRLRFPPYPSHEKNGALPPVTAEKTS